MSAHTEAVEAACRASYEASFGAKWEEAEIPEVWHRDTLAAITAYLRHMRAAGYVVTKVPEERRVGGTDWLRGRNAARAEMLANAVEVPE